MLTIIYYIIIERKKERHALIKKLLARTQRLFSLGKTVLK
jgi:hypothetical protein